MFKSKINYLILSIVFILGVIGVYLFFISDTIGQNEEENNIEEEIISDKNNNQNEAISEEVSSVSLDELPKMNFRVYYWDFTTDKTDGAIIAFDGADKGNFLAVTLAQGSGGFTSGYLYKNGKLFFETGSLYHGFVFFDYDNYLNTIHGVWGESNFCPSSYILDRYKYNPETNEMQLKETKEYPTKDYNEPERSYCANKELGEFIEKERATSDSENHF